ncbi:uncharacterized protein LOC130980656 [Arachis stenosperma]|uniref:uncharacterized protein LOC130980656 n=1 Tax=Arachis stenosperma TaxID=217475 RepID=UPI0025ABDD10|nr:uncharacterized protein LOC130980656 [Arachis stenosperma]
MRLVSWNCRGLGNPWAVRALNKLLRQKDPKLVFLMKTRKKTDEISRLRRRGGLDNIIGVDCRGEGRSRAGGLAVLWGNDLIVEISSMSENHIDMVISKEGDSNSWRATCFYGYPEGANKNKSWEILKSLRQSRNRPWLVFGDFNQVLEKKDKQGGLPVTFSQIRGFKEALQTSELLDLGFVGHAFTWSNNQGGEQNVQERLDRAVANISWKEAFPRAVVQHLQRYRSDHSPIFIDMMGETERKNNRSHRFKFEEVWLEKEECEEIVKKTWIPGNMGITRKLQNCSSILKEWGQVHFRQIPKAIKEKQKKT